MRMRFGEVAANQKRSSPSGTTLNAISTDIRCDISPFFDALRGLPACLSCLSLSFPYANESEGLGEGSMEIAMGERSNKVCCLTLCHGHWAGGRPM